MAKAKFSASHSAVDAILTAAIPLFAQAGFSGVAMRQVAQAVGISIATLYHHFPDKPTLYLKTIEAAFADKAAGIAAVLAETGTPEQRLQKFVLRFTEMMSQDSYFRRLLQRELLDGDETRLRLLANQVFKAQFLNIAKLAQELVPGCDPHLMAISIAGLVLFHLEMTPLRQFLPGGCPEHNQPDIIARHVTALLLGGVQCCGNE